MSYPSGSFPSMPDETGLTAPTVAPSEPRKLPAEVVLTFPIDENTGIRIVPAFVEKTSTSDHYHLVAVEYWADGVRVERDEYAVILRTIEIGEKLSTFDDLHDQLAGLLKRYATKPEENPDGPTDA